MALPTVEVACAWSITAATDGQGQKLAAVEAEAQAARTAEGGPGPLDPPPGRGNLGHRSSPPRRLALTFPLAEAVKSASMSVSDEGPR